VRALPASVASTAGLQSRSGKTKSTLIDRGVSPRSVKVGCDVKRRLDPRKLFELSGSVLAQLGQQHDRELLSRRLGQYLRRERRGRLHLPNRFPEPVKALRYLSRAQITQVAYWVNPSMSSRCTVSDHTASIIHQIAPGMMWTDTRRTPSDAMAEVVKRLPQQLAPRVARPVWPSSPDLFEIMEMSRRGKATLFLDKIPLTVKDCLTKSRVADDIRLASRIVRQQIVGVRTAVGVPIQWIGYFRHRYGFLILSTRHNIPSGLVRFLIGQWIKTPTSLWLVEPCPFKIFLRRHRYSDFIREAPVPEGLIEPPQVGKSGQDIENIWKDPFYIYSPRLHYLQEMMILETIFSHKSTNPTLSKT